MSSISEAIIQDHRDLERDYNEVLHAADLNHQERFGNQFTWELARHSTSEELVLYPAFEKFLPDGKTLARDQRKEHHKASQG